MRFPVLQTISVLLHAAISLSVPIDDTASSPAVSSLASFPGNTAGVPEHQCPHSHSCGVVTYHGNKYFSFGTGTCMPIGGDIQSIYVNRCYCSLWSVCTGNSDTDVYLSGMMMCPRPAVMSDFSTPPMYISCGGLNAPN